jgi:hypothetical protein
MAVQTTHFQAPTMLRWSWPLKLSLFTADGAPTTHSRPEVDPRFAKLVDWQPWPDERGQVNVLICLSSPKELLKQVQRDSFYLANFVPILLILDDSMNPSDSEKRTKATLEKLADKFGASGVFCLDAQALSGDWLTGLVVELSHDHSLPETLHRITPNGYFYYDQKLEKETRLRHYVEGLIGGLRAFFKNKPYKLNNRLVGSKKKISGSDLADELEARLPYMGFNHETDEATDTAELTQVLTEDEDPLMFNINNDLFDYASSGPLESAGGEPPPEEEEGVKMAEDAKSLADSARYLQAMIADKVQSGDAVTTHLLPYHDYLMMVRIGLAEADWLQGNISIPDEDLFQPDQVEAEAVEVVFMNNISGETQKRNLLLPPTGNSRPVRFSFRTVDSDTPLDGILYLSHKGRIFQEAHIYAEVAESNDQDYRVQFNITKCLRRNLSGQEGQPRSEFGSTIRYDPSGKHGSAVNGLVGSQLFTVKTLKGLDKIVDRLMRWIESAATNPDTYTEDLYDEDNQNLLRTLAFYGSDLYSNWVRSGTDLKGPIQVVDAESAYLPVEFIYTVACPAEDAPLCSKAREALLAGTCQQCCDLSKVPAPCICPLGFVGLREVIERSGRIIPAESEPDARQRAIPVMERALFATADKVAAHTAQLNEKVAEAVTNFALEKHHANTWPEWETGIATKPTSLVLIVHTEQKTDIEKLEIGNEALIPKMHLSKEFIRHPDAPYPPLAIVLGCRTTEIAGFGFDIGSHFLNNGAAIVFTSFTKILGRQAGPIVIHLLAFLKTHQGEERAFGEVVLQLRQYLLANGIMAGLALVAYGDADWKIKI